MESGMVCRTLTPEDAEALLPQLKEKTAELLGKMRDAEAGARRTLSEKYEGDVEAAWEDEEFRQAVYKRREHAFAWGEAVYSLGVQPVNPAAGEVIAHCTDGDRRWREGDEGYSVCAELEPSEEI